MSLPLAGDRHLPAVAALFNRQALLLSARLVELVDTLGLGPSARAWGFESLTGHQRSSDTPSQRRMRSSRAANAQIAMLLAPMVPAPQGILGGITQLASSRLNPLAELDRQLDCSKPVCLGLQTS